MHRVVEIFGTVFVVLGGIIGVLLMIFAVLMLISLILDKLRVVTSAIKRNKFVRGVVREVKRRKLRFKKRDPYLLYPSQASPHNASFFDQIGLYRRGMDWGD